MTPLCCWPHHWPPDRGPATQAPALAASVTRTELPALCTHAAVFPASSWHGAIRRFRVWGRGCQVAEPMPSAGQGDSESRSLALWLLWWAWASDAGKPKHDKPTPPLSALLVPSYCFLLSCMLSLIYPDFKIQFMSTSSVKFSFGVLKPLHSLELGCVKKTQYLKVNSISLDLNLIASVNSYN